jgi:hypothetical protein
LIDKLEVLSPQINLDFETLALQEGHDAFRYDKWIDLRKTKFELPAILHFKHRPSGQHKLILVGVAKLGWTASKNIIERVFPVLEDVKIHRIDFCADFYGISVLSFAENLCLPGTSNFTVYKRREGVSYYLQSSPLRSLLAYDKARSEQRFSNTLPNVDITRFEVQLRSKAIPFRSFLQMSRYAEADVIGPLEIRKPIAVFQPTRPNLFLAANGFRVLVSKYGLDGALKLFPSSYRAFLKKKFLGPVLEDELNSLRERLRKGVSDWLSDRIRFPRLPKRRGT